MSLDFVTIYLFTGAARIALGFMIASNIYTTVAYLTHERLWSRIGWGISEATSAH
jgi:adenylylsulfate kinase